MYTRNTLPTDGTTGPFPIGFNYLDGNTITVGVADTEGGTPVAQSFTFVGTKTEAQPKGTAINLATAIPTGKFLIIRKVVDMDTPVVQWGVGTELTQSNLKRTTTNLMEMAQTAHDLSIDAVEAVASIDTVLEAIEQLVPQELIDTAAQVASDKTQAVDARIAAEDAQADAEAALAALIARLQSTFTLDFGDGTTEQVFTITVSGLSVGQSVRVDQVAIAAGGRDQDEAEMDCIVCRAYVSAPDTLTIYAQSVTGSVHGLYSFALTY